MTVTLAARRFAGQTNRLVKGQPTSNRNILPRSVCTMSEGRQLARACNGLGCSLVGLNGCSVCGEAQCQDGERSLKLL